MRSVATTWHRRLMMHLELESANQREGHPGIAPSRFARGCPALLGRPGLLRQCIRALLRCRGDPSPRPFGHFPGRPAMLGALQGTKIKCQSDKPEQRREQERHFARPAPAAKRINSNTAPRRSAGMHGLVDQGLRTRCRASQASRDQPEGARRRIAALAKQYRRRQGCRR
jgi:hypothetical protein